MLMQWGDHLGLRTTPLLVHRIQLLGPPPRSSRSLPPPLEIRLGLLQRRPQPPQADLRLPSSRQHAVQRRNWSNG